MRTYTGQQNVDSGLYFNLQKFSITSLDADGPLPGDSGTTYRRVPMLLMLAVAPLLGLAFVMFLPFIGFAVVARLLGGKAVSLVTGMAGETVRVRRPGWVPALAFLSRSKPVKTSVPPEDAVAGKTADAWVEDVEKQLEKTNHAG